VFTRVAFVRSVVGLALMGAVALGCSGAPSPAADDPKATVQAALDAAESGGLARLSDFACAAQRENIASIFAGGGQLAPLASAGIDLQAFMSTISFRFDNVALGEPKVDGDRATVRMNGALTASIDEARMKEVIRPLLQAQGLAVTDQMLDTMMQALTTQLGQGRTIDEELQLVRENGRWLICS
jgi:hypothetical protein